MTRIAPAAATALALALAACTAPEVAPEARSGPVETAPQGGTTPQAGGTHAGPADSEQERDACGIAKVAPRFTGAQASAETRASIAAAVGERPIRYFAEGDPVTMDYNEQRLNVVLTRDGRIIEFRCG